MKTIKMITLATATLIAFAACHKKSKEDMANTMRVYKEVDNMPEFKGGTEAMYVHLGNELQYPEAAKERGEEGKVMMAFVVDENGKVRDVEVVKGLSEDLNTEAIAAIKSMPDWTPGSHGGENVAVQMHLPIVFKMPKE